MNTRERAALAEAIEHCALNNADNGHVTPEEKIAEWQAVLGESGDEAPPPEPFTVGDTVRLKSGGSSMTVIRVNDDTCDCAFFQSASSGLMGFGSGQVLERIVLPRAALEKRP